MLKILGDHYKINFFVSIYESGSDDNTKNILRQFESYLNRFEIPNKIVLGDRKIDWAKSYRIEELAALRNKAIEPLLFPNNSNSERFDHIFFLNDVFNCPSDVLQLLIQHLFVQESDITCGVDWWWDFIVYDIWASKDMTGQLFRPYSIEKASNHEDWPIEAGHEYSIQRIQKLLPYQQLSCWGGMVLLNAKPFYENNVKFRSHNNKTKECAQSECFYISKDFWKAGYKKVIAIPTVISHYLWYGNQVLVRRLINERFKHIRSTWPDWENNEKLPNDKLVTKYPKSILCVSIAHELGANAEWKMELRTNSTRENEGIFN